MTDKQPWSKPEVHTVERPGATTSPPAETEEGEK